MKMVFNKTMEMIIFFFTPQDSSEPFHTGEISFKVQKDMVDRGAAKALFWIMNAMIFTCFISQL